MKDLGFEQAVDRLGERIIVGIADAADRWLDPVTPVGRQITRVVRSRPWSASDAGFDYGAQYFTVRDPGFRTRVEQWHDAGQAAPWPATGEDAWVGTPAMSANRIKAQ
jgi:hypothetical protein